MHHLNRPSTQTGVVLVIGLLLLLIITIVAVASMSNTHMQERMAGNAQTQALAFEVASEGASKSLAFYLEARHKDGPYKDLGGCTSEWRNKDDKLLTHPTTRETIEKTIGDDDVAPLRTLQLTQWMYCLQPPYEDVGADEFGTPIAAKLFVLSRGEVLSGDTVVARRDIETHIGRPNPVESCTAICIPHCEKNDELKFPTSNIFRVFGEGNPAITTGKSECTAKVKDSIRDDRIGNYDGGVAAAEGGGTLGWPWDDPNDVVDFANALRDIAKGKADDQDNDQENYAWLDWHSTYKDEGWAPKGNDPADLGSQDPEKFALTYVDGDAVFRGSDSGAGILVVNGNLEWKGTPDFKGLILVTGGSFKVSGGGQGGDPAGSLVVLNLDPNPPDFADPPKFRGITLDLIGGGTAQYRYDCRLLQRLAIAVQDLGVAADQNGYLKGDDGNTVRDDDNHPIVDPDWSPQPADSGYWDETGATGVWLPSCGSGTGQDAILAIRSMRESLGWREPELLDQL